MKAIIMKTIVFGMFGFLLLGCGDSSDLPGAAQDAFMPSSGSGSLSEIQMVVDDNVKLNLFSVGPDRLTNVQGIQYRSGSFSEGDVLALDVSSPRKIEFQILADSNVQWDVSCHYDGKLNKISNMSRYRSGSKAKDNQGDGIILCVDADGYFITGQMEATFKIISNSELKTYSLLLQFE
ncbi:MAG: hypothetical protein A3B70_01765 [Deltaproteobacteria bacterium RIFCSPHIGHO2_02_FULL_40_11]|nr:MAG: hypothetical protein A3B70_01765 [Deltaproteobacteria bacterium RIFCSPHIGHO2_02_FULL_40_11]